MKNYKINISYDGTDYHGWQHQPNKKTIVGQLQDSFKKVFNQNITILGASRTDAGVHAHNQYAVFKTDIAVDEATMARAWNGALPNDIVIKKLQKNSDNFHPHYQVKQKTYEYRIFTKQPSPFKQRFGWHYFKKINKEKLHQALQQFIGTHDFRAFCTIENVVIENTTRKINSIEIIQDEKNNEFRIIIVGEKFLRYQIRRMVGAALKVASNDMLSVDVIAQTLKEKNPNHPLPNAPAKGLCLLTIEYGS